MHCPWYRLAHGGARLPFAPIFTKEGPSSLSDAAFPTGKAPFPMGDAASFPLAPKVRLWARIGAGETPFRRGRRVPVREAHGPHSPATQRSCQPAVCAPKASL